MLVLGIDTSGKSGGITLAEGDQQSLRVLESASISGGTFSAQLVPSLASLLHKRGLAVKNIDGFAVASGPGSFTGLRVGLSAVKGLVEALGTPIVTVSILQAIAAEVLWGANRSQRTPVSRVAMDASRNEVFFGEYELLHHHVPKVLAESLISLEALAERVQSWGDTSNLVTTDIQIVNSLRRVVSDACLANVEVLPRPSSEDIARLGIKKLLAGETVSAEALDANYLRRSDAEIFFKGGR